MKAPLVIDHNSSQTADARYSYRGKSICSQFYIFPLENSRIRSINGSWCVKLWVRRGGVKSKAGLKTISRLKHLEMENTFRINPNKCGSFDQWKNYNVLSLSVIASTCSSLPRCIHNQKRGKLTTRIYRKPSNTNIGLKPQSCQDPKKIVASFKGELCRCYRLCSSPEQIKKEIKFTLDLYEDNGHNRQKLKLIADSYTPPTVTENKHKNKKRDRKTQNNIDRQTKNLFDLLPFKNVNLGEDNEEQEEKLYACINYIPEIAPQIKRSLAKAGITTTFTSAPKLKDILCSRNKSKPDKTHKKGIYKHTCTCSPKAIYIGQTGRSYSIRWEEHSKAIDKQQWHHSGITQHHQHCQHKFDKANFSIITNMQDKNKRRLAYNLKVREAIEIRHHNSGPGKGLNEDMGAHVKTDIWDPALATVDKGS